MWFDADAAENAPFSVVALLVENELIARTTAEHLETPRITLPRIRKSGSSSPSPRYGGR
jgi:hypothetical protein